MNILSRLFSETLAHLAGLASHPQHRPHAHPKLASNAADAGPLGAGRHDGRYLVSVGILANAVAVLRPSVRPGKQPMIVMTGAVAARRHPGVR